MVSTVQKSSFCRAWTLYNFPIFFSRECFPILLSRTPRLGHYTDKEHASWIVTVNRHHFWYYWAACMVELFFFSFFKYQFKYWNRHAHCIVKVSPLTAARITDRIVDTSLPFGSIERRPKQPAFRHTSVEPAVHKKKKKGPVPCI